MCECANRLDDRINKLKQKLVNNSYARHDMVKIIDRIIGLEDAKRIIRGDIPKKYT